MYQVGHEIGWFFQADVQPHQRIAVPAGNDWIGERQAFVATPRGANSKQAQAIDEAVSGRGRNGRGKLDRQEAVGALEVAPPQGLARIFRQGWIENALDPRLLFQPGQDFGGVAVCMASRAAALRRPFSAL